MSRVVEESTDSSACPPKFVETRGKNQEMKKKEPDQPNVMRSHLPAQQFEQIMETADRAGNSFSSGDVESNRIRFLGKKKWRTAQRFIGGPVCWRSAKYRSTTQDFHNFHRLSADEVRAGQFSSNPATTEMSLNDSIEMNQPKPNGKRNQHAAYFGQPFLRWIIFLSL